MPKKVLVIDDDRSMTLMVETILKSQNYAIVILNYPKFVMKTIREEAPDLVLLDVIMPYQDGYKICQEIKAAFGEKLPVILYTCQPYEKDFIENAHKEFGADDFLRKPFAREDLLNKIEALIGKSEPSAENPSTGNPAG